MKNLSSSSAAQLKFSSPLQRWQKPHVSDLGLLLRGSGCLPPTATARPRSWAFPQMLFGRGHGPTLAAPRIPRGRAELQRPEQRTCYCITARWKKAGMHRRQAEPSKLQAVGHAQCHYMSYLSNYFYQVVWAGLSFLRQLGGECAAGRRSQHCSACPGDFALFLPVAPPPVRSSA